MTIQEIENAADENTVAGAASAGVQKTARATKSARSGISGAKTKQDQLVTLLSKPNGARISTVTQKLGWQAHTVRAAISGLRKRGHEVSTSKSPKSGELVYAISAKPEEDNVASTGSSS